MKSTVKISEKNMESYTDRTKKTERADLENKKGIFFQIGLIMALSFALFAFEWKTYDKEAFVFDSIQKSGDIETLPPIIPLDKPEPKIVKVSLSVFKEVKNTDDVKDVNPISAEVNPNDVNEPVNPITIKNDDEIIENEIFRIVEKQPVYPGGESALFEYLGRSIKYPTEAREIGIHGTVYINFIIEKDGSVSNVSVARGIGGGCDEEAVRVIKSMSKWNPGLQREKPVRVQFNVPIKFTLSN